MKGFEIIVGVVQSIAVLGALYFAWRTVREATAARGEDRDDRRSRTLSELLQEVAEFDLQTRNANGFLAERSQLRMQVLLARLQDPLPDTRAVASAGISSVAEMAGMQAASLAALNELRNAAQRPFGH